MDVPQGARLLSIGEIFDRAVNLLLRNFSTLVIAYSVVELPFRLIADWLQWSAQVRYANAISEIIANPRLFTQFQRLATDPTHKVGLGDWGLIAFEVAGVTLASGLLAKMVLQLERGVRPGLLSSLPQAFGRWFSLLIAQLAIFILLVAIIFVAFIMIFVSAGVYIGLQHVSLSSEDVFGLIIATLVTSALPLCWLEAISICSFYAVAVDDVSVGRALTSVWKIVLRKGVRVRSLAFGIGITVCDILGVLFSFVLLGLVDYMTRQPAVGVAVRELAALVVTVFINVTAIVFYLDAKARYKTFQDGALGRENSAAR